MSGATHQQTASKSLHLAVRLSAHRKRAAAGMGDAMSMNSRQSSFVCIAIATLVSVFGGVPAQAAEGSSDRIQLAQSCQMFGPYATMNRANQIANEARQQGYSAIAFHNGDGYYVRVC